MAELSGLGRHLPNPDLLIGPYVNREAVASSKIEGTQADLSDLLLDEVEPKLTPPGSDVIEVRNYVAALYLGLRSLDKLPLSGRLVRDMHRVLMQGVRGDNMTPGEFRRSQNWIGPPGCTLIEATYVPPPHDPEMHECIARWEQFMNERGTMPELLQCALIHEHFEAIHPFLDGNGRIGRLLITLFLIERKRLSKPLLYLSSYIEQHKSEYYELLQAIRIEGDWTRWYRFFLTAVRETARSAIEQADALLKLRDEYRDQFKKQHRELSMIDDLFVNPFTTVARAASRLDVTQPTASKTIDKLVKAGMLREATGREWGRVWVAHPILMAVDPTRSMKPAKRMTTPHPTSPPSPAHTLWAVCQVIAPPFPLPRPTATTTPASSSAPRRATATPGPFSSSAIKTASSPPAFRSSKTANWPPTSPRTPW
ncbi:MAG: Fic family protein [Phycisphaeraceae bacterium]|nr:Fic family protein [Phycisphaeraceae bacterium]